MLGEESLCVCLPRQQIWIVFAIFFLWHISPKIVTVNSYPPFPYHKMFLQGM